jgi:N-acetyl-anhydromuramyl-L-alanine amidase AmpD
MSKTYKIFFFALFLLVLGAISLYFLPVSRKEITAEKKPESAADNIQPNQPKISSNEDNESQIIEKNNAPASKEETTSLVEKENPSASFKVNQKLVSWGYSKPQKSRAIDTIIIHSSYNALGGDPYNLSKLIQEYKEYGVSPHYLIDREGNVYQLVSDKNIAYHAGESKMPDGRTNVNNFSLGIEIMTTEDASPSAKQYSALKDLISLLKKNYRITNILGHNQISPGRKTDPWNFDWKKL